MSSAMNIKQILRKKYFNIKREMLSLSKDNANGYHYALRQNLQTLITNLLNDGTIKPKNTNNQLLIGTYLPIIQKQIIPPCISQSFQHKVSVNAKYFTPSFTLNNKSMHFVEYVKTVRKNQQLRLGAFGVKVPIVSSVKSQKVDPPNMDLLLVPLICIEESSLQRIGYGGGYYDNYIKESKPKKTISIGIALQSLVFNQDHLNNLRPQPKNKEKEELWDQWDQPLDFVITQTRIIKKE